MQQSVPVQSLAVSISAYVALISALTVRDLRTEHRNASLGILLSVAQPVAAGFIFYLFSEVMGLRPTPIRGDAATFLVLGFLMFFLHTRTVAAVGGAIKKDMMNHQRATPFLFICVKAFALLYKSLFAVAILLVLNLLARDLWVMQDGLTFLTTMLAAWIGGVAVGTLMMALHFYVSWAALVQTLYVRTMFFTSGVFFVANGPASGLRDFLGWNPLFHLLDQMRGAVFLNYTARTTDLGYAISVYLGLLLLGFLVEAHIRRTYSISRLPC